MVYGRNNLKGRPPKPHKEIRDQSRPPSEEAQGLGAVAGSALADTVAHETNRRYP